MKRMTKYNYLLSALLLLGVLLSGCNIREDNTDCPRPFRLFIKAIDYDGTDITELGDVKKAVLFIFNEKQEVVDMIELDANAIRSRKPIEIKLDYPGHESLSFVVWGNLDENVDHPPHSSIQHWRDFHVNLKQRDRVAESPGDLFFGSLSVPVEYGGTEPAGDQTVIISRRTAQVSISALGLQGWNGGKEGNYTFRVKETPSSMTIDSNLNGGVVSYIPQSSLSEGNLKTPIFNTFPTENDQALVIEILYNGEVIYSESHGTDGEPFTPEVGRVLNIVLDFRAELNMKVVITPWNVVYQYVEI